MGYNRLSAAYRHKEKGPRVGASILFSEYDYSFFRLFSKSPASLLLATHLYRRHQAVIVLVVDAIDELRKYHLSVARLGVVPLLALPICYP